MIGMFFIFGLATIGLYIFYVEKIGSFVNAISIYTGVKIAVEFILEPIAYLLDLFSYDFRSIFIIYLLSFLGYAAFILGILRTKLPPNPPRKISRPNHLAVAWMLLIAAWGLYAPVLVEFSYLITDPRRIYELTRTGYGIYTFGSALLSFLAYIVFLMSSKKRALLFYGLLLTLMILKGSKGQFFVLAAIFIISKVYLEGFRYSITRSAVYGLVAGIAVLYIFTLNYRGEMNNVFITMSEYSDYNRNGALVLQDKTMGSYGGQLSEEMLWVPKIPRAIWPNKPKVFGEFRLAAQYFPDWFILDQGSPSFGIGVYFADFGWFSFILFPLVQFLCGLWLGRCLSKLITSSNAFYFIMSVYLSGSNLLAAGSGTYVVEHIIIGASTMALLGIVSVRYQNDINRLDKSTRQMSH